MKTRFKVNTGADGNLLPLGEFFKHFPNANMTQLAKTFDPHTKLYAFNNTEIKQLGVCELMVEYKTNRKICEFYVVDFPTAILGIHNSENLKLITIQFDSIETEMSQPESELLPKTKQCEYKELFTGIGNMNTVLHKAKRRCSAICSTNQKGCTCPLRTIET